MTKQEFENRTNVQVSFDEYKHIEAVYMAPTLTRTNFAKCGAK